MSAPAVSAWRPALRIARRNVRRNLGRSALIAALVAVPVAGATLADVLARTLSAPERERQRIMGSADAIVEVTSSPRLVSAGPSPFDYQPAAGGQARDPASVDVAALLPDGTRLVPKPQWRELRLDRGGGRTARTMLVVADPREPLHRHEVQVEAGRAPGAAGEVMLTRRLAERLDVGPGAMVRMVDGPGATVTGIGVAAFCLDCQHVFAAPGSLLDRATAVPGDDSAQTSLLADLPRGASATALLPGLAGHGVALIPRELALEVDGSGGPSVDEDTLRAAALVAVIAGIGLLEVVLLAGTAFAVGARRQTRELGLVAATGGSARDIRRIVLAQGLVLGALGAAAGVAAGFALAIGLRPLWENLDDGKIAAWAFGPWEIAAAALVGLLSGLAAAVVPAVGAARMRPVDALAGRFRRADGARGRRAPLAGLTLLAAGAACGIAGDRLLADDFAAYAAQLANVERTGAHLTAPAPTGPLALILGGATLVIAGLVLLAPWLIGRLARAGARLPVSARLAVRDAARHRHRTGPATSAIAVAVAGSVVLALLLAGQFRADELRHVRALPPGVLAVDPMESGAAAQGAARAAAVLPEGRAHRVRVPLRPLARGEVVPPDVPVPEARGIWVHDARPGCGDTTCDTRMLAIAGDPAHDALLAGAELDDDARAALATGKAVVFNGSGRAGAVQVEVGWDERTHTALTERLPAHEARRDVTYSALPAGIVTAETAREHGWDVATAGSLVTFAPGATPDQVDAALDAAEDAGVFAFVERGPMTPDDALLLIVAGIAAFITIVGVAISVALSAAEGRADLATLAAIGAAPRRRRALAGSQALVIAGVGCALGVALGVFVAFTARATTGSPEFVVPWANLAVTGLAVPLLAVTVAALFTPSRLPLVRRAE